MSERDHKKHNHFHFGFFLVAFIAMAFVFAFSGERAAEDATNQGRTGRAFEFAGGVAGFIADHWWVVPLAIAPFWIVHFLYSEWKFLMHVYHLVLFGMGIGFMVLYFQLDQRLFSMLG